METRRADLAGAWYPGRESECRRQIEEFMQKGIPCPPEGGSAVGGIVPHAGWVFSGRIACSVIRCLKGDEDPDTCVIFGRHLPPSGNRYIMTSGAWETPLGSIEIDSELAAGIESEYEFVVETGSRYEQDNTIELQLPFIKYFFPETRILPIGVPPSLTSLDLAARVAGIGTSLGRRMIVIGSTDLTHYGMNYGFTPKGSGKEALKWVREENDRKAVELMVNMDARGIVLESLKSRNACCGGAAGAAVEAAHTLGAVQGEELVYATSYDVRPDSSFVGYAGLLFYS